MSVKETTNQNKLDQNEQQLLDTALLESDQLLARSLYDDETRRKRRRVWLSVLVLGVAVMSVLLLALYSGWLAISAPVVAGAKEKVIGPSDQEWQERLLSINESDNWFVGAKAGMELAKIPGNRPYEILAKHWPRIAANGKKQILKGFTPGMMGNKEMHPKFFDVMHLGMIDPDAEVRSFAANYIKMQGLPDFFVDPKGYAEWRKNTRGYSAAKIAKTKNLDETKPSNTATSDFQNAWKKFFGRDYKTSERLFRKVLERESQNPHAMNGLGWSLLNQGRHEEAEPLLLQALDLEEEHWGAMTGLAACFEAEGKLNEAIKLWERIVENSTSTNTATEKLAPIYLERKQYDKALKCYEKLVEWYPDGKRFSQGLEQAKEGINSKR